MGAGPGDAGSADGSRRSIACTPPISCSTTAWCRRPSWTWPWAPQCVSVARRVGPKALTQDEVTDRIIAGARAGLRVVRLKAGDPFVFGRGGEEARALVAAGVPFEIVPGLSSAIAAPALAGIPVTHRGLSAAVVVVSGHDPAGYEPVLGAARAWQRRRSSC